MLITRKISLAAIAVLSLLAAAVAKPPASHDGLVLWFQNGPSAGTVKDSSGHRNDGKTTSLVVSNSASLVSMQDTHQLTLALWIKPNSIPHEFPVLISKGGNEWPGAYGGYELMLNWNGDNDIIFASGGFEPYTAHAQGSLINNHLGEWIHVAFTLDTVAQAAQFYVNGQAVTNLAWTGDFSDVNFNVTNNLYIGAPDPAANANRAHFDGEMSEIMIFNRALSAGDIQSVYSLTKPEEARLPARGNRQMSR
ncbi:MAG TPA: LamG domain-containing protein [Verrucomicrobiae bacterium]|nr:LamG domain-containing protein [Verrucomicrobiae bacterium]